MPIKSIEINNFQAHQHLKIDFSPRITTITGPSDRGKSAILRALVWVMTNKPNGDDFIRYGANECSVTVYIDDHVIERIKGKKRNIYILDGIEYKAIKTDVPEEISKIFNINQNNIQQQFDNIFWFSETAGEVGRNLNSIVDLDIIDFVMGNILSRFNTARSKNTTIQELIEKQEQELEGEEKIALLKNMVEREEKLENILSEKEKQTEVLEKDLKELIKVEAFIAKGEAIKKIENRLEDFLCEQEVVDKKTNDLEKLIDQIENTTVPKEIPENILILIERTEELNKQIEERRKEYKYLSELIEDLENEETDITAWEKNITQLEQKFHSLTNNQICPLCGNMFKE